MESPKKDLGLSITLGSTSLQQKSNFFSTVKVDFVDDSASTTQRTDVCKNTFTPEFRNRSFFFKVPNNINPDYTPTIHVNFFEVIKFREGEKPIVKHYATGSILLTREIIGNLCQHQSYNTEVKLLSTDGLLRREVGQVNMFVVFTDSMPPLSPMRWTQGSDNIEEETELTFILHIYCGVNLVSKTTSNGILPSPFVTAKTTGDAVGRKQARAATSAAKNARNVIWNERLLVNINEKERDGIFLSLIDYNTRKYISKSIVPITNVLVGQVYNLKVVVNEDGGYLLVSLGLEPTIPSLISQFTLSQNTTQHELINPSQVNDLCHLEIFLRGVKEDYPTNGVENSAMFAVLRILHNSETYHKRVYQDGVLPPPPFSRNYFSELQNSSLAPLFFAPVRISPVASPSPQPTWNYLFEYNLSKSNLCTQGFSLIVEFYRIELSSAPIPVSPLLTPQSPVSPYSPFSAGHQLGSLSPHPDNQKGSPIFSGFSVVPLQSVCPPDLGHKIIVTDMEVDIWGINSCFSTNSCHLLLDMKCSDTTDYLKVLKTQQNAQTTVPYSPPPFHSPKKRSPQISPQNYPGFPYPNNNPHPSHRSPTLSPSNPFPDISDMQNLSLNPGRGNLSSSSESVQTASHISSSPDQILPQTPTQNQSGLYRRPTQESSTSPRRPNLKVITPTHNGSRPYLVNQYSPITTNTTNTKKPAESEPPETMNIEKLHELVSRQQVMIEKLLAQKNSENAQGFNNMDNTFASDPRGFQQQKLPPLENNTDLSSSQERILLPTSTQETDYKTLVSIIHDLQTENAKIPLYLETAQKQEKVIMKLETLLVEKGVQLNESTFPLPTVDQVKNNIEGSRPTHLPPLTSPSKSPIDALTQEKKKMENELTKNSEINQEMENRANKLPEMGSLIKNPLLKSPSETPRRPHLLKPLKDENT
eukprot:TRINITY_DN2625_c1_g1_i2.p1 TRINITY_DN2625_c1_g1~~TRINITY_DN2625_c1_g1_i2.p1  ORF type:complete len:927 (-),score=245.60 TRINITY_DN2625_c1_g1_i2:354-3134(-)